MAKDNLLIAFIAIVVISSLMLVWYNSGAGASNGNATPTVFPTTAPTVAENITPTPAGQFFSTPTPAPVHATPMAMQNGSIRSCSTSIDSPGYYYLDGNLGADPNTACINLTMGASNSVLDCKGHSLTGNGTGTGVWLLATHNVTVQNCEIHGFSIGISITEVSMNGTITGNANKIYNNTVWGNNGGILLHATANDVITGNNIYRNEYHGIFLDCWLGYCEIYNTTIANNTVSSNGDTGIALDSRTARTNVTGNIISNNTKIGLSLVGDANIIAHNTLAGNGEKGVYLAGRLNNFTGNTITESGLVDLECYEAGCEACRYPDGGNNVCGTRNCSSIACR